MIDIAMRYKPFCHAVPTTTLLPGTDLAAEISPAKVIIFHPVTKKVIVDKELPFGYVEQFTVTLDLEKQKVAVSGFQGKKPIRYDITPGLITLQEPITFPYVAVPCRSKTRLSFGCHKAQDVTMMFRRRKLEELLPYLFFLAQQLPANGGEKDSQSLLKVAEDEPSYEHILQMIEAGFTSLFYPENNHLLGFSLPAFGQTLSPHAFIQSLYALTRSLFISEEGSSLKILPTLFKEFHAGRITEYSTQRGHTLFLEWTKKMIRQLEIIPSHKDTCSFTFPPDIKRFRLRCNGCIIGTMPNGMEIELTEGMRYHLDRFEK